MEHKELSGEIFENFIWRVENFSRLDTVEKLYSVSEPFVLGGYPWRIVLYPQGNKSERDNNLSIYLVAMQTANMSEGWSRVVKFKFVVFNQLNTNMMITIESSNIEEFNASSKSWGFTSFMPLVELHDPEKGFLVKDACVVGAEVFVCKSTNENHAAKLAVSITSGSQTSHTKVEVPRPEPNVLHPNMETISAVNALVCIEPTKHTYAELFSPSIEELMDFSSVGKLEEVCSDHPSLINPQPKRSRKFTDLAFAALGRVLYFLKTRKVRDMNAQACKDLQVLWQELEKFRFDLTWLEPRVQSALGMKSFVEKAMQVEKLKENVAALEVETERLKAKLVAVEINFNIERDLLKGKGMEERDLDSEL